ncbi:hypothetical protein JCM19239_6377 [Vibrio variabilis]|uniref:Uncharacterized protein n=1 Tax=Vibrio variabilis TaxID=990271 RepID=A0ABQ0JQ53_9VIBR|nr:hypothetical protein JCM19239_6377 [Vibrio variabilis]
MRVWYHRHNIATAAVVSFLASLGLYWVNQEVINIWFAVSTSLVFLVLFYSGYINPHLMMRARMKNGIFVPVEQA